jgi:hypothetical protein
MLLPPGACFRELVVACDIRLEHGGFRPFAARGSRSLSSAAGTLKSLAILPAKRHIFATGRTSAHFLMN